MHDHIVECFQHVLLRRLVVTGEFQLPGRYGARALERQIALIVEVELEQAVIVHSAGKADALAGTRVEQDVARVPIVLLVQLVHRPLIGLQYRFARDLGQ
ncbi:hypothetical protein D3C81_1938900 [compost metagenome]